MARWKNPIPSVTPVSQEVLRVIFASISDWFSKPSNFLDYGAFSDTTDQVPAAANTAYPITLNTTDVSNNVSVVSGSQITFANTGVFNLQWSGQFQNTDTQLHDATVWLKQNGVDIAGSTGYFGVPNSHGGVSGHTIVGWNYFLFVEAGDYIQLYWEADSTDVTLQFYPSALAPVKPSTASVVVTVTQVG